jgi:hypothetical protein
MTKRLLVPLMLLATPATLLRADLAQVKAEPNLEKRSKLALDYAEALKMRRRVRRRERQPRPSSRRFGKR